MTGVGPGGATAVNIHGAGVVARVRPDSGRTMSGLTRAQYNYLTAPIVVSRVAQLKGQSHLEAWDIRRHLIRFFGFGGWDFTVVNCDLVSEIMHPAAKEGDRPRYSVIYRVIGRLTIRTPEGATLCTYEDGATGDSVNQPSFGDAHDMALKTAMSQALKRCAVNLGDQFGLSLYDNGTTSATVTRSLVAPPEETDDSASDSDGGGPEPGPASEGVGPDSERPPVSGSGGDGEAGGVRPGVQSGVHRGGGVGGSAQAPGDRRDAPAAVRS